MSKNIVSTDQAPQAIGTYSQAVKHQGLVFISGQIPLDPVSMEVVEGGIEAQIRRVFENLSAVCKAAGGSLDEIVKLGVFLTDMGDSHRSTPSWVNISQHPTRHALPSKCRRYPRVLMSKWMRYWEPEWLDMIYCGKPPGPWH